HADAAARRGAPQGGADSSYGAAETLLSRARLSRARSRRAERSGGVEAAAAPLLQAAAAEAAGGAPGERFAAATGGGGGAPIPYQKEMERSFGEDFSGVTAHVGQKEALDGMGANAAARGDTVAFASSSPDREVVAHELTHVVQQRRGGGGAGAVHPKSE